MKQNKIFIVIGLVTMMMAGASCKKYLDSAFPNPNKPTSVDPDVAFPSMENIMARGVEFDARFTTRYVQYWAHVSAGTSWDMMGYDPGSDNGGDQWRTHYFSFGQNLLNVINQGRSSGRLAYTGAGWALFAWSWLVLTDNTGEVILKEAFHADQLTFKYDTQPDVYDYVKKITDSALYYLNLAKAQAPSSFSKGDQFLYNGNLDKWIKFTYAIKAMVYHRYFLKSNYSADSVINFVDKSFASNADNASVIIPGTSPFTSGLNFFGPTRGNVGLYLQTDYVINLMNGTIFGGVADPRMAFLFKPSLDGQFHGLPVTKGVGIFSANQRPPNFWGLYGSTASPAGGVDTGARSFFKNTASFPVITYPELQFIRAEAAFKKGDKVTAYSAYINGINGSFDLLSQYFTGYQPITASDRTAYLANAAVVPATPAALTLSQIMLQKYLALWPYGSEETWVDMRRYQYDPAVYTGFVLPNPLYTDNNNKPVQRLRPRYNSEYLWNVNELTRIGATAPDYHTKPVWFSQP